MRRRIYLTAATLRAMLCFMDPTQTPKIAATLDSLAQPLIDKIKEAVGTADGTMMVSIGFNDEEVLYEEFNSMAGQIATIFKSLNKNKS